MWFTVRLGPVYLYLPSSAHPLRALPCVNFVLYRMCGFPRDTEYSSGIFHALPVFAPPSMSLPST